MDIFRKIEDILTNIPGLEGKKLRKNVCMLLKKMKGIKL